MNLVFATTNKSKYDTAQAILKCYGISVIQKSLDIDEIQGENFLKVIRDKAKKAYESLRAPVVVSDDWHDIPVLHGFPGAYMKSVNYWFEPEDLISLMSRHKTRDMHINLNLCYFDGDEFHEFTNRIHGTIIDEPRGKYGTSTQKVIVLDSDHGLTISEVYDRGLEHSPERLEQIYSPWHQLAEFLELNRPNPTGD